MYRNKSIAPVGKVNKHLRKETLGHTFLGRSKLKKKMLAMKAF